MPAPTPAEIRRLKRLYRDVEWMPPWDRMELPRLLNKLRTLSIWRPREENQGNTLEVEDALWAAVQSWGANNNDANRRRARAAAKVIIKGRSAQNFSDQKKVFEVYKEDMLTLGIVIPEEYRFQFTTQVATDIIFATGLALGPRVTSADTVF